MSMGEGVKVTHTEAYFNSRTGVELALSQAPAASSRAAATSSRALLSVARLSSRELPALSFWTRAADMDTTSRLRLPGSTESGPSRQIFLRARMSALLLDHWVTLGSMAQAFPTASRRSESRNLSHTTLTGTPNLSQMASHKADGGCTLRP